MTEPRDELPAAPEPEPPTPASADALGSPPDPSGAPTPIPPPIGIPAEPAVTAEPAPTPEPGPPPEPSPFSSISLSARRLVAGSFDLMASAQRDLRNMSFYIGFVALVTIAPLAALLWAMVVRFGIDEFSAGELQRLGQQAQPAAAWLLLALFVAFAGFFVVSIESQTTTIAVLGSRLQGRPLTVSGALLVARRRFWRVVGAGFLVGILSSIAQAIVEAIVEPLTGGQPEVTLIVDLVTALLVQAPFVYAVAGIVLGEVGVIESLRRSTRLFRARPGLAVTIALFGVATQFLLLFGVGAGLDLVIRIAQPFGLGTGGIAIFLGTVLSALLTFAFGTLVFTAAALAAAPQVLGFVGLTHYVGGLDAGRASYEPQHPWQPFVGWGLAIAIVIGLVSLLMGIVALR